MGARIISEYGVMDETKIKEIQKEIIKVLASNELTIGEAKMVCAELDLEFDKQFISQVSSD